MSNKIHFCDTDVWIKLCCMGKFDLLFIDCDSIYITEVVKEEILHLGNVYTEFKPAREMLIEMLRERSRVQVIYPHKHFEQEERQAIVAAALRLGFEYGVESSFKNFGETSTAILADIMEISIIKSDDEGCKKIIDDHFWGIEVKDLYDILDLAVTKNIISHIERINMRTSLERISKQVNAKKKQSLYYNYENNLVDVFLKKIV